MAIDTIGTNAITNDAIKHKIADGAVDADMELVHSVISVKGTIINSVATTITIEIGGKFASSVDVKYLTLAVQLLQQILAELLQMVH